MPPFKLERTMHVTHNPSHPDAKAVEESDPAGRYVLGGAGAEIPEEDAKRYGLVKEAPKAEEAPAEAKAVSSPPENKALSSKRAERK